MATRPTQTTIITVYYAGVAQRAAAAAAAAVLGGTAIDRDRASDEQALLRIARHRVVHVPTVLVTADDDTRVVARLHTLDSALLQTLLTPCQD